MRCQYKPHYFEKFPIKQLHRLDFSHMHYDGLKTGGMDKEDFLSLRDDIAANGLINPIIVEVDAGQPPRYRIAMGNNRVEVVDQLGDEYVKALVFFKAITPPDYLGTCTEILDSDLEEFMKEKHPGDDTWKKSGWADRLLKFVATRAA
jgi:hypothetical protein